MFGEAAFLLSPEGGVVGEEVAEGGGEGVGIFGEGAAADELEEVEVSFFLSGDEVVDEHGAAGGEGFVDGGAAGFADDEVVAAEEFGDFFRPALDLHAAGVVFLDFAGAAVEFPEVASEDDGEFGGPAGVVEDGAGDASDGGSFGGGEEEGAERFGFVVGADGGEFFEAVGDGESGFDDLACGDVLIDEVSFGFGVGDEPVVGGGVSPGGVDVDGVGDYGDDRAAGDVLVEGAFEEVGVEGVGADDDVGAEFPEAVVEGGFRSAHEGEGVLGEVPAFDAVVDPGPGAGAVGGDEAVSGAEEFIDPGGAFCAGVDDFDFGVAGEGLGEVSGGAVVSIAETRGGNQDAGLAKVRHLGAVVPGLGGCVHPHLCAWCSLKEHAQEERSPAEEGRLGDSGIA